MSAGIPNQQTSNYVTGLLVEPADLLNDQTSAASIAREIMVALTGSGSIQSLYNALTFAFSVNGSSQNVVSVPGGQGWVFTQSSFCDSYDNVGSTTMPAVVPASGSSRVDGLYIKPVVNTLNGPSRTVRNEDGTTDTVTLTYNINQYQVKYLQGTDGVGTAPSAPSGWELYATFSVVGSAAPSNLQIVYYTLQQQLIGANHYPVTYLNGSSSVSVSAPFGVVTVSCPILDGGNYVPTVNGHHGAITLSTNNNNTLHDLGSGSIEVSGPTIEGSTSISTSVVGTDGSGNTLIQISCPVLDSGDYVGNVNGYYGSITLSAGNQNTLHDQGGGALEISGPSFNAGASVNFAVTGTDVSGNSIISVTCPILDSGSYVSDITASPGINVSSGTGNVTLSVPTIVMRKYFDYTLASFTVGSLGTTPAGHFDILTHLGSCHHASPISSNQEVRIECQFTLATSQTLSIPFNTNAAFYIFLDGTYEGTVAASSTAFQTYTQYVSSGAHTLVFQFYLNGQIYFDMGAWLPASGIFVNPAILTAAGPA